MDYNSLLDNTEFNENKLKLLENVVNILYKTTNNNDRATADQILKSYKQMENSWQHCDKILTTTSCVLTKIFAASILEELVKTKFNLLSDEHKEAIRNFIVDILIKTVAAGITTDQINAFVNKLNIIIVAIAKSEWSATWKSFMTEICNSSKSSQELCENNIKILINLR